VIQYNLIKFPTKTQKEIPGYFLHFPTFPKKHQTNPRIFPDISYTQLWPFNHFPSFSHKKMVNKWRIKWVINLSQEKIIQLLGSAEALERDLAQVLPVKEAGEREVPGEIGRSFGEFLGIFWGDCRFLVDVWQDLL
jgi:hypothetical protein